MSAALPESPFPEMPEPPNGVTIFLTDEQVAIATVLGLTPQQLCQQEIAYALPKWRSMREEAERVTAVAAWKAASPATKAALEADLAAAKADLKPVAEPVEPGGQG